MARRLKTLNDIRRYLADVINRLEDEKIEPALAGRIGYLCNILKGVIEGSELEKRVEELEKIIADKR